MFLKGELATLTWSDVLFKIYIGHIRVQVFLPTCFLLVGSLPKDFVLGQDGLGIRFSTANYGQQQNIPAESLYIILFHYILNKPGQSKQI